MKVIEKLKSFFLKKEAFSKLEKFRVKNGVLLSFVAVLFSVFFIWLFLRNDSKKPSRVTTSVESKNEGHISEQMKPLEDNNIRYTRAGAGFSQTPDESRNKGHRLLDISQSPQILTNSEVDHTFSLLPGTLIPAMLLNKLVSTTLHLPVMSVATEDVYHPLNGALAIERGSKLIGQASYDPTARRIHIHYHTLVSPGQKKLSISGLALDKADQASSGLSGKYHSEELKKIAGMILGTFIGGVAKGFQDKHTGPFGILVTDSSIKNALLQGASEAALSQADRVTQSLNKAQGYVEVSQGTPLLIFLTQDFFFSEE